MPPLPKRKLSRRRQGNRRAHKMPGALALTLCPNCQNPKLPHRACPTCGTYAGRQVLPEQAPTERE